MKKLILALLILPSVSMADFLCDEESGQLQGDVYHACGIFESKDENEARQKAFVNAKEEFHTYCMSSSNCIRHYIYLNPKRTSCKEIKRDGVLVYKCARLVDFKIDDMKHQEKWELSL